jgi:hypothetical protein
VTRAWPPVRFGALLAAPVALALPVCALLAGPARARAGERLGWCALKQLRLSPVRGAHALQVQVGGTVLWYLRIRHHGASACRLEERLRLVGARTSNGAAIGLHAVQGGAFGPARGSVTLRAGQSAYVAVWDPATWTLRPIGGCRRDVTLRFRIPPAAGMLSARPPAQLAVCPGGALSLSETFSASVFGAFFQELDETGARVR